MSDEKAKVGFVPAVLLSDPSKGTTLRASSVLQKNTKLYGPMNALDENNGSSSWNSEGNCKSETALILDFGRLVIPETIKCQFQAGFSAESSKVFSRDGTLLDELEFEDVHEVQSCELESKASTDALRFVLDDFSDFYGRVILYKIEVWGREGA